MGDSKDTVDNPPAFPSGNQVRVGDFITGGHAGMELRDYFAAAAIPAIMENVPEETESDDYAILVAKAAYLIADAMLKARGQQ